MVAVIEVAETTFVQDATMLNVPADTMRRPLKVITPAALFPEYVPLIVPVGFSARLIA